MRIAFFTETFYPTINGVATSIRDFSHALQNMGHEVEVFAPKPGGYDYEGIPVHRFTSVPFTPYPGNYSTLPPLKINKLVKNRFDVIHTHGPFSMGWAGIACAKSSKIPCVTTFHTPLSDYVHYLFKNQNLQMLGQNISWKYTSFHYNFYDKIFVPSQIFQKVLEEHGINKPISVMKTGIDPSRFKPKKEDLKKLGLNKFFINHGRISKEKNVNTSIEAMPKILKKHPKAKLVVTGKGPALKDLKEQAKKLGVKDNVVFLGFVEDNLLFNLFKEAEFGVICSEAETQGIVILEEMLFGLPVIGADYLATSETIKNGENGFLFDLYDSNALAKQCNKLLDDKKLRNKLSAQAKKTAKENTIKKWAERLITEYESLPTKK